CAPNPSSHCASAAVPGGRAAPNARLPAKPGADPLDRVLPHSVVVLTFLKSAKAIESSWASGVASTVRIGMAVTESQRDGRGHAADDDAYVPRGPHPRCGCLGGEELRGRRAAHRLRHGDRKST